MKELRLPDSVEATIEMLDRAFPLRNFPVGMPYHEIQRELGKRDVVDFVRSLQKAKVDEALGVSEEE